MKTRKLILILIISTIASTNFGQVAYIEGSYMNLSKMNILHSYHKYLDIIPASGSIAFENNINTRSTFGFRDLDNNSYSEKRNIVPLRTRITIHKSVEKVFESNLKVENWMTIPFLCNIIEEEQALESWMCEPFFLYQK